MMFLVPFFLAVAVPRGACHEIDSESVLARDVAKLIPAFSQLPEDFLVGYVQASGTPRMFRGSDLEHIAKNRGVELHGLEDLCLARRTFVPQAPQIRDAMQLTLGIAGAKIEILSSSQQTVPTGEIIFPRNGIQPPAGPDVMWRGYVQASKGAKFPIWTRARITATMNQVVAAVEVQPGKPIQSGQVRLESSEESPFDDGIVRDMDEVAGLIAKARIQKGSPIRKSQIERPMDVARGDLVRVEVFTGGAHLTTEARAETAGTKGSTVTVRNLSSGKEFRAEVKGKDQVMVGDQVE